MHIPNGFLDPKMSAGLMAAAAGVLSYSLYKVREAGTSVVPMKALALAGKAAGTISSGNRRVLTKLGEQKIYLMGMTASLVFAAQMFNFPIGSGTSGHLLGGVFSAIILGPFAGTLVISAVLAVQSLFFADGGLFALGANIINMAFFGTIVSYYIYFLRKINGVMIEPTGVGSGLHGLPGDWTPPSRFVKIAFCVDSALPAKNVL